MSDKPISLNTLNGHSLPFDRIAIPPDELYGAGEGIARVYADGGVMGSSRSTEGGAWAWCHVTAKGVCIEQKSGLLLPTAAWQDVTNNYAEYVAAVRALEALSEHAKVDVFLDSLITIGRLRDGWATNGLPPNLVRRGERAVSRLRWPPKFHLLDGHPTKDQLRAGVGKRGNPVSIHNVWCDNECTRIMQEHLVNTGIVRGDNGYWTDTTNDDEGDTDGN